MNGLEVRIEPFGHEDDAIVRIVRAPNGLPSGGPAQMLQVTDFVGGADIKVAGRELFDRLKANHEVEAALQQLLDLPQDTPNPVYLDIDEANAKALPWEQLCIDDTFLALSWSWQVARLSNPRRPEIRPYVATPSIRLLAVLSALKRPAIGEWNQIKNSLETGIDIGLDISMLVTASELEVRSAVQEYIDAGHPHVTQAGDVTTMRLLHRLDAPVFNGSSDEVASATYLDPHIEPWTTYYYRVVARAPSAGSGPGMRSGPSTPVKLTTLGSGGPAAPIIDTTIRDIDGDVVVGFTAEAPTTPVGDHIFDLITRGTDHVARHSTARAAVSRVGGNIHQMKFSDSDVPSGAQVHVRVTDPLGKRAESAGAALPP